MGQNKDEAIRQAELDARLCRACMDRMPVASCPRCGEPTLCGFCLKIGNEYCFDCSDASDDGKGWSDPDPLGEEFPPPAGTPPQRRLHKLRRISVAITTRSDLLFDYYPDLIYRARVRARPVALYYVVGHELWRMDAVMAVNGRKAAFRVDRMILSPETPPEAAE